MLTDEYVAGFFDGEGTVFMQRHGAVEVRITQVDRRPLEMILARYGFGSIASVSVGRRSVPCWQYRICNWRDAAAFLIQIAPHLIVKKAEVDVILAYATRRQNSRVRWRGRLTPELSADREETLRLLRALKHPGRLRSDIAA